MRYRKLLRAGVAFAALATLYLLGPAPASPEYDPGVPVVPEKPDDLESFIARREKSHRLKPDNEARIIWADSARQKTSFSIIYLHGFSASQKEGDPVHRLLAKEFGCNLYLARIADHGVDTTEALLTFTAERAWNSAKEALAIGNAIGEKVIIVSTSTGGTLALMLAAGFPQRVHALINLSPNIAINDPAAFLLNDPWGLQIARAVLGSDYRVTRNDSLPVHKRYWNGRYRIESLVQLEELVESGMTRETFQRITQPVLTLYYYKNETEQDPEVKVSAMLAMHDMLGTPDSLKMATAIPTAGAHVIGGALASSDVDAVYREMRAFAIDKLHLPAQALAATQ